MAWEDFRHRVDLRVRWAEVDMQAVVFNGHYLTYCDICLTEYWRAIGVHYPRDFLDEGSDTYVRKATVEYHAPALFDDELALCGRVARLGRTSLSFRVAIFRRGQHDRSLIDAELVYVNASTGSKTPVPWTPRFRDCVRGFEIVAPEEAHG